MSGFGGTPPIAGYVEVISPYRPDFAELVPLRLTEMVPGRCPWCRQSIEVDPLEIQGVCPSCDARYSAALAMLSPEAKREDRDHRDAFKVASFAALASFFIGFPLWAALLGGVAIAIRSNIAWEART